MKRQSANFRHGWIQGLIGYIVKTLSLGKIVQHSNYGTGLERNCFNTPNSSHLWYGQVTYPLFLASFNQKNWTNNTTSTCFTVLI